MPRLERTAASADPSQLTDVEDPTLANVRLTNGARLYVDHAHPEYSSPEVTSPRAAVTWDRAGERVTLEAVPGSRPAAPAVNLYKNNTDGKGPRTARTRTTSWRARRLRRHRAPPQPVLRRPPGHVRFRPGRAGRRLGHADTRSRSEPTSSRGGRARDDPQAAAHQHPDEPHAVADRYAGCTSSRDANLLDVANLLKVGSTSLVLGMIEADPIRRTGRCAEPVATLQTSRTTRAAGQGRARRRPG